MNLMVQHVDGMRFLVTADGHAVVVDAAPQDGGGGTAMSGPQLFVAATGACILEFVANSCRLRGVPVEHLSMEMTFQEMSRPRRVGALEATIHIQPDPADEIKRRLLGVARHATLVNTLMHPPDVQVHFAEEGGQIDADL